MATGCDRLTRRAIRAWRACVFCPTSQRVVARRQVSRRTTGRTVNLRKLAALTRPGGCIDWNVLKRPLLNAVCFGLQRLCTPLRVHPKRTKNTRRGKIGSRYGEHSKPNRYLIIGLQCYDNKKGSQNKGHSRVECDAPAVFSEELNLEQFVSAFDPVQFLFKLTRRAFRFRQPEEPPNSGDAPLEWRNAKLPIKLKKGSSDVQANS